MAAGDAHVCPGFLTPVVTQLSFQSHRLLFSHASAEVRGKNMPERKFTSTGDVIHNHQVMSPTRSPLRHRGMAKFCWLVGWLFVLRFNATSAKVTHMCFLAFSHQY